jgi:hypothetical protein
MIGANSEFEFCEPQDRGDLKMKKDGGSFCSPSLCEVNQSAQSAQM